MRIIIHGTIAFDRIMVYPGYFKDSILPEKIHQISVSFNIDDMDELRGGTGSNIAYNLALLQEKPLLISAIGKDGTRYLEFLKSIGLPTDAIEVHDDILTAAFSVVTDKGNNQIGAFFRGALKRPTHFDFSTVDAKETIAILAPANNSEDTLKYLKACKDHGIRYMFDPGQTISNLDGEQLRFGIESAYLFIVNDYELELVKKKTGWTEEEILSNVDVLIVTLAAEGSVIRQTGKKDIRVPAFKQDRLLDPTGAGDAYRAGLLAGYAHGVSLEDMGRLGSCAASFAIEHVGTQEHTFTMDSFRKRYTLNCQTECPL